MSQPMEDDLAVLRRLRDGEPLTTEDYGEPVDDYLDAPWDAGAPDQDADNLAEETTAEDDEAPAGSPRPAGPSLRDDLEASYIGSLAVASLLLGVASWAGLLSWFASIAVVLALLTTLVQGGRRVTPAGSVGVAFFLTVSVLTSAPTPAAETQPAAQSPVDAAEST